MKVLRITAKDVEELLNDIEEAMNQPCPKHEVESRYRRGCALAYNVTRSALDNEEALAAGLIDSAMERMGTQGTCGIAAGLICRAVCLYMDVEQAGDREAFKTKFIAALDKAVQEVGKQIEEQNDTSTEQSSQVSSDQSPATP